MGGRYLVSGAQLGTLIAHCKTAPNKANDLLNQICADQCFIEQDNIALEQRLTQLKIMHQGRWLQASGEFVFKCRKCEHLIYVDNPETLLVVECPECGEEPDGNYILERMGDYKKEHEAEK